MKKYLWVGSVLSFLAALAVYCTPSADSDHADAKFRNLADSVSYVGIQTCRSCHPNVFDSFIKTGMGQSFSPAHASLSNADFGPHALVYDAQKDFYYKPFLQDSSIYIKEFRLENGDTIYQRTEKIAYIIGSGHHTNSHIVSNNGYIYQAPITFYTQEAKWDLAPGFEDNNTRFTRLLNAECITCHNHFPEQAEGSFNKFTAMPSGIECERCHGPGEIHVKEKLAGFLVDTSKYVDYSIVNPRHLSRDRQMDICQRCHLQGIAVLKEGKSFFDFKPGMPLASVMNVFLPRYTNTDERFIMASQADRLKMSKCFTESSTLSCLTCHNPHHSVQEVSLEKYNSACLSCHTEPDASFCPKTNVTSADCVGCHMPPSGSIDIPHVTITDHYLSKGTAKQSLSESATSKPLSETRQAQIAQFLGVQILTKDSASPLELAQAYIALYDKFVATPEMLDSALYHLQNLDLADKLVLKTWIHYYFARKDFIRLRVLAKKLKPDETEDGWTAYRIGEAYYHAGDFKKAALFFEQSVSFYPLALDFQEKLGSSYIQLRQLKKAEDVFLNIIRENPKEKVALCNLGYCYAIQGKLEGADQLYDKALALDPDYVQALVNKAGLQARLKKLDVCNRLLDRVFKLDPDNEMARQMRAMFF